VIFPDLLIVGAPHSGTRWMASVLSRAGIACSHERAFPLSGIRCSAAVPAEASWPAIAHLGTIEAAGAQIVHQVREPIAWLNSWVRTSDAFDAWALLDRVFPGFEADRRRSAVHAAMALWVAFNRRCEAFADRRFRVEEIVGAAGVELVLELGALAGVALSTDAAQAAVADRTLDRNHHPDRVGLTPYTWSSLPDGLERDEFRALARSYGYGRELAQEITA
jgi:hypothetical protein